MTFSAALRGRGLTAEQTSGDIEWWTPREFFNLVDEEFGFDIDLCANSRAAAKCRRFHSPRVDSLKQDWRGTCWLNPPYTPTVRPWLDKAADAAQRNNAIIVALVVTRWDVSWWRENVLRHASEIRLLTRSLRFQVPRLRRVSTASMPGALVIYRRKQANVPPTVTFWDWRELLEQRASAAA